MPQTYDNVTISSGTTVHLDANATAGGLTLNGALDTANTLTVNGTFNWNGNGSITNSTINIPIGSQLNIVGNSGSHLLDAGSISNAGAMTLTGSLTTRYGATISNLSTGSIDIQGDYQLGWDGNGAVGTISNAGSIIKSSGTGSATLGNGSTFNDSSTIESQAGTIYLNSAVTGSGTPTFTADGAAIIQFPTNGNSFPDGTTFTGAGQILVSANSTFTGDVGASATPFGLEGGATQTFSGATLRGTMQLDNAFLTGSGLTIASGSTLNVKNSGGNQAQSGA